MPKRKRAEISKSINMRRDHEEEEGEKEEIPMPPQDDEEEDDEGRARLLTKDNAKAEIDRILNESSTCAERFFADLRPIKRYKRTRRGRRPGICVTSSNLVDALGGDIFRALGVSSSTTPSSTLTNQSNNEESSSTINNNTTQQDEKEEEEPPLPPPPAL